jgi:hypothetical protein
MEQPERPLARAIPPLYRLIGGRRINGPHQRLRILHPHGVCLGLSGDCSRIHGKAGIWGDCSRLQGNVSGIAGDVTCFSGDCSQIEGSLVGKYGDCTGLSGDVSKLTGDLSQLRGDATGLEGDCTGLAGDLDRIPADWRRILRFIRHWVPLDGEPTAPSPAPPLPLAPVQPDLPLFAHATKENPAA